MASLQAAKPVTVSAVKALAMSLAMSVSAIVLCLCLVAAADAQEPGPSTARESWTATTQTYEENTYPTRTTESHAMIGDRRVDQTVVEVLLPNGQYQSTQATEHEVVQVNATTTDKVEWIYRWDVNGHKNLLQVTEEDAQRAASGDVQTVRTTSVSDGNGNLQVRQREVSDTKTTSPDTQQTNTTLYLLDGNGDLTPSMETQELRNSNTDHMTEVKQTTLVPDSSGNWRVSEVRTSAIGEDGGNRNTDERVSDSDSEGRLAEVSHTIRNESETAAGEKSIATVTYSTALPGLAPDGDLHLNQRVTSIESKVSSGEIVGGIGGEIIEQQVEQATPGDPTRGLQASTKTEYIVQSGNSGTQQTKTIQVRDQNGTWNVVCSETRSSDQVPGEQVRVAPSAGLP